MFEKGTLYFRKGDLICLKVKLYIFEKGIWIIYLKRGFELYFRKCNLNYKLVSLKREFELLNLKRVILLKREFEIYFWKWNLSYMF